MALKNEKKGQNKAADDIMKTEYLINGNIARFDDYVTWNYQQSLSSPSSRRRQNDSGGCFLGFLFIIPVGFLFFASVAISFLLLPMRHPNCNLQDFKLNHFDLSPNRTLTASWNATIRIYYDDGTRPSYQDYSRLNISVSYLNETLAVAWIPPFDELRSGNSSYFINTTVEAKRKDISMKRYGAMKEEIDNHREVELDVAMRGGGRAYLVIWGRRIMWGYFNNDIIFRCNFRPRKVVVVPRCSSFREELLSLFFRNFLGLN